MESANRHTLPSGRQPWDRANGLRAGTVAGALVGAAVVALTGLDRFWVVATAGAIGGAVGYCTERRKQGDRPLDSCFGGSLDP